MKTLYKNLLCIASGASLCLFLAIPANAQRGGSGGGGGGSRPSGGGGGGGSSASSARPSGGGGGGGASFSRPSGGGGSVSRPSGGGGGMYRPSGGSNISRPTVGMVQRGPNGVQRNPMYVNRQGVAPRGINPYVNRQGVGVRGNYGIPPRVGIAAGRGGVGVAPARGGVGVAPGRATAGVTAYRTAPRIGYRGYWGNHGYYHYNHGYYGSYYTPNLGFRCRILPFGYYPFFWGDDQYYFCNGLFYSYDNEEYTVVEPPIGAEITTLPEKAQSIVINGQQYFECNGVYYQQVTKDDGTVVYMVAGKDGELNTNANVQDDQPQGPQLGDIISQLPPDCRKIKVNGEKLYISPDGVYYQEQIDANGVKTYKVVGLPSDEPDQN